MVIKGRRETDRHVEAVLAACDIMGSFLQCGSQSVKRIIDQTGLTRNRVMRLAGTLEARGYLHRDSRTGGYGLGIMVMSLGKVYESQSNLCSLGQPILQDLAHATGESASIYVLDNLERVVLARAEGEHDIRMFSAVGQRTPVYVGAMGKMLLAFAPNEVRKKILKGRGLIKSPTGAVVHKSKLAEELDRIKAQGFAISFGERVPDAAAVSAPIFEMGNRCLGALGIAGPIHRFTPESLPGRIKRVMSAAAELSWHLGGLPSSSPDPCQRLKCYVETYAFKCAEDFMKQYYEHLGAVSSFPNA